MNKSWFLARRLLLWRQEQRHVNWSAVISTIGVAVGSAVLILSLSILNGFEGEVRDSLVLFENRLTVYPWQPGVDLKPAIQDLEEAGITAQPYAERKVVIQSGDEYRLVTARVIPDLVSWVKRFDDVITRQLPYEPNLPGIMIGSLLADRLHLLPGDEVSLLSPLDISLADPRPPQLQGAIQSIYEFGILDFDDAYLFLDFETAEQLFPRLADYSALTLDDGSLGFRSSSLPASLVRLLPEDQWEVRTWEADHRDLLTAMRMEKLGSTVVLFLIVLVACFNATSTMVMAVMEKYRQVGILRSMGATRAVIRGLFLRQGLFVGVMGVLAGIGMGTLITVVQMAYPFLPGPEGLHTQGSLPMQLQLLDLGVILLGSILISVGAAWYPARYASSIAPALAVNYEK